MLSQYVAAGVQQFHSRLFFAGRIKPGVGPFYFYGRIRVYRTNTQRKRVDAAGYFRQRHSRYITDLVALGTQARRNAGQIAHFIHAAEIGGHVIRGFVAGAMEEIHIRMLLRHIQREIHKAVAGGENHVAALIDHIVQRFFAVRIFRYAFFDDYLIFR